MKRKTRLLIGAFLIINLAIIGFYEYKLREYRAVANTVCYQVKKGVTITEGEPLKKDMFQEVSMDINKIPHDYIKNLINIENMVAAEEMYDKDILRESRIMEGKQWMTDNERYVWIDVKSGDIAAGNDLKPGDIVDIFTYRPSTKDYGTEQAMQGLMIVDLKDTEGMRYIESKDQVFTIQSICFKMDNQTYNFLINRLKEAQEDYKISIHGNRPKIERKANMDNSMLKEFAN